MMILTFSDEAADKLRDQVKGQTLNVLCDEILQNSLIDDQKALKKLETEVLSDLIPI